MLCVVLVTRCFVLCPDSSSEVGCPFNTKNRSTSPSVSKINQSIWLQHRPLEGATAVTVHFQYRVCQCTLCIHRSALRSTRLSLICMRSTKSKQDSSLGPAPASRSLRRAVYRHIHKHGPHIDHSQGPRAHTHLTLSKVKMMPTYFRFLCTKMSWNIIVPICDSVYNTRPYVWEIISETSWQSLICNLDAAATVNHDVHVIVIKQQQQQQ